MQYEYIGPGSLARLSEVLEKEKPSSVFVVTGKNSYQRSGAQKMFESLLSDYKVIFFSDFSVNPQLEDVKKGIALFRRSGCDLVIAIGGGSVIDIAKSINFLAAQYEVPEDYITKKLIAAHKPKSFVAIPTTAGTGSEATHFAVVYIGKTKYSLGHQGWMLPKYVFLDPNLSFNLPKYITASTGIDALCQAVESYWSTQSTEESKEYARKAIKIILDNLASAVNNPSAPNREAMLLGANLAGKAINVSKTTACHAVSYPMTSYFGVSHGHACALTLGEMCLYNSAVTDDDCLDGRGAESVKKTLSELCSLFQVQASKQLQEKINNLMDQIGLTRRLVDLKINSPEHHDIIVAHGFNPERVNNNPRELTEGALRDILKRIS
ncbi:MAG: phosphonoacetaldehyde reductase [Nanoarchaeota archaeon]|nr:phosphonoacetaldehyde reductase [Nanoarchaeota archaeon]